MDHTVSLPRPEGEPAGLMARRRSVRAFAPRPAALSDLSLALFAAQGRTHARGFRAVPSAGALYPLELYLAAGEVQGLAPGIYRYLPADHALTPTATGDMRTELASACFQEWTANAPCMLALTAVYARVTGKYGERGVRYAHIEAGAAAQNANLALVSRGLGATVVGAFDDERLARILGAGSGERPLVLMPAGTPA